MRTAIGRYTPTRRDFLVTATAAAGATALGAAPARAAAKYRRYNVTSAQGQKALASYAKGVRAMLKLPADHPHNWFRNAFVHLMDCPHGNWWFYVWHRGYLGFFERTIRNLSGDHTFAIPYWDWTQLPQIPDGMFDDPLTPRSPSFAPYTATLARFTAFVQPAMTNYWNGLSAAQRDQLNLRGYESFDDMWNDVTGNGDPTNEAFAMTTRARYLTRGNPKLDPKTAFDVQALIVGSGLLPMQFNDPTAYLSFTSAKTTSHNAPPTGSNVFSMLEGLPHNNVHNYTGGYGAIDAPWGNMTNNLSPVDPLFFLHHSNMDRLWDIWTRKQRALHLPYLPPHDELATFSAEPFLFFVGGDGKYVGPAKAGDFLSTAVFDYDYEPGFGENVIPVSRRAGLTATTPPPAITGTVRNNTGTVVVPGSALKKGLTATQSPPLILEVKIARPSGRGAARSFDVLVNAPPGVTQVSAGSPYYAGTIAFFGAPMRRMNMPGDATFAVPLRRTLRAFGAAPSAASTTLTVRVVPSHGPAANPPKLEALSIRAL
jgi:tyrosinase